MSNFSTISEAIADIKKGKLLIVVDDPKRENEGDFFIPADTVTPKKLMTMIRFGGGLICVAITEKQANRLALPLMVTPKENTEQTKVNFTISVNAKSGISTGVSAFDRVLTIKTLANPQSHPDDLVRPGHIFGLVAKEKGVLERPGHTEAAVDLSVLAGFHSAGVLCEIIRNDGKMAKRADLLKLSQQLQIKMVSIHDLIRFRQNNPAD